MPRLIIRFVCGNPEERAHEFQNLLFDTAILRVGPQVESQGNEHSFILPQIQQDTIERIFEEGRGWCLERVLMIVRTQSTMDGIDTTIMTVTEIPPPTSL